MSRTRPPSQADGGLASKLASAFSGASCQRERVLVSQLGAPLALPSLHPPTASSPSSLCNRPSLRCGVCPGNKNRFSFFKYLLVVRPVFLVGASEEAQGPQADVSPHFGLFPAGCNSFFGVPRAPGQTHAARVTCCSDGLHSVIMGAGDGGGWVRRRFLKAVLRT